MPSLHAAPQPSSRDVAALETEVNLLKAELEETKRRLESDVAQAKEDALGVMRGGGEGVGGGGGGGCGKGLERRGRGGVNKNGRGRHRRSRGGKGFGGRGLAFDISMARGLEGRCLDTKGP